MKTRFTVHAFGRVRERLNLTPLDVGDILEKGLYIQVGFEDKTNKVHKLFYSEPDDTWFVVVQDEKTCEVVTILPYQYKNRWGLSTDTLRKAKDLLLNKEWPKVNSPCTGPQVWRISAYVVTPLHPAYIVNLGNFPIKRYDTPVAIAADPKACNEMWNALRGKIDEDTCQFVDSRASRGSNGDPISLGRCAPQ